MSMKLSTAVTLMIGSVIGSVLILVYALWFMQISGATRDGVKDTALAVARTLADAEVKRGLTLPPESGIIQPLALAVARRNGLLFAVVTNMDGIRYSHPNSQIIGKPFIGEDIRPTLAGRRTSPSTTACWLRRCGSSPRCLTTAAGKSAWWRLAFR